jgi:hypothetical protein
MFRAGLAQGEAFDRFAQMTASNRRKRVTVAVTRYKSLW